MALRFDGPISLLGKSRKSKPVVDPESVVPVTTPVTTSAAPVSAKKKTKGLASLRVEPVAATDPIARVLAASHGQVRQAPIVQAMVDIATAQTGNPFVLVGKQIEAMHVGLRMWADPLNEVPGNLALEYLFGLDVFPLGLFIVFVGPPKSGKSTLAYEIMRYFGLAGGTFRLIEVESKVSPELLESILHEYYSYVQYSEATTVEGWQHNLVRNWDTLVAVAEGKFKLEGKNKVLKNIGYTIPHLDVIDTISGKDSIETMEEVETSGAAGRGHAVHALSISKFLKAQSHRIRYAPFSVVMVNQQKDQTKPDGTSERSLAGGKSVQFQEAIEIEMRKVGDLPPNSVFSGYVSKLKMRKNSLMPERELEIRVMRAGQLVDPVAGTWVRRTWFDWNWALINLLFKPPTSAPPSAINAGLKRVGFHLAVTNKTVVGNKAWSKNLGMTEKDAVSWSELGHMIHSSPELTQMLRGALFIAKRHILEGDFRKQQTALLKEYGAKYTADQLAKMATFKPLVSKKARKKAKAIEWAKKAKETQEADLAARKAVKKKS